MSYKLVFWLTFVILFCCSHGNGDSTNDVIDTEVGSDQNSLNDVKDTDVGSDQNSASNSQESVKREPKPCDPRFCNHEGECSTFEGKISCACFDEEKYFNGDDCTNPVNLCATAKCSNGATCKPGNGQYICEGCPPSKSGQFCDQNVPDLFKSLIFSINHYVYYGHRLIYVLSFADLGTEPFKIDLRINGFLLQTISVNSTDSNIGSLFRYCRNLPRFIRSQGIRNPTNVQQTGYYYVRCLVFYDLGLQTIQLKLFSFDGLTTYHENTFKVWVLQPVYLKCIPNFKIQNGISREHPLILPMDRNCLIKSTVTHRCHPKSKTVFCYNLYERDSRYLLKSYGCFSTSDFSIRPYSLQWNCGDPNTAHYILRIEMKEVAPRDLCNVKVIFMYLAVLPVGVEAKIIGGDRRTIGPKQRLVLDGRKSRNYCKSPKVDQRLSYQWHCESPNNPKNTFCRKNLSNDARYIINTKKFKIDRAYKFTLIVRLKLFPERNHNVTQVVKIVKNETLDAIVVPIRNSRVFNTVSVNPVHLRAVCLSKLCYHYKESQDKYIEFKWSLKERAKEENYNDDVLMEEEEKKEENDEGSDKNEKNSGTNTEAKTEADTEVITEANADVNTEANSESNLRRRRASNDDEDDDKPDANALITGDKPRFIFTPPKPGSYMLNLKVRDLESKLKANQVYYFNVEEPPSGGTCTFKNKEGTEFETLFELVCSHYSHTNAPLIYKIFADSYMLQYFYEYNENDQRMSFYLPYGPYKYMVKICDKFDSCSSETLDLNVKPLDVPLEKDKFLEFHDKYQKKSHLEKGNSSSFLFLLNAIARNGDPDQMNVLFNDLDCFLPLSLRYLNVISLLSATYFSNIKERSHQEVKFLYLLQTKVNKGLQWILKNDVANEISIDSYEHFSQMVYKIMDVICLPTEYIMPSLRVSWHTKQYDNLQHEEYDELPYLSSLMLRRPIQWCNLIKELGKTFHLLNSIGVQSHHHEPDEKEFVIQSGERVLYKMFSFEGFDDKTFEANGMTINFNASTAKYLQCSLKSNIVFVQLLYIAADLFWWTPNLIQIKSDIVSLQLSNRNDEWIRTLDDKTIQITFTITQQHTMDIKTIPTNEDKDIIENFRPHEEFVEDTSYGSFQQFNQRTIHIMRIQRNCLVKIEFVQASADLRILIGKDKKPFVVQLLDSKTIVKQSLENSTFIVQDNFISDSRMIIYLAIMAAYDFQGNVTYAFKATSYECLRWNFDLFDPLWSTSECRAVEQNSSHIVCECNHLSYFAANVKSLKVDVSKDDKTFFYKMPINRRVIFYYAGTFTIFLLLIIGVFLFRYDHEEIIIVDQGAPSYQEGFTIYVTSGNAPNSGTTSNMIIRFFTNKGIYKAKIFQDPRRLFFKNCCTCLIHISSRRIIVPFKLELEIDNTGRYPSWLCESIKIVDFHDKSVYHFNVNKWVSKEQFEIHPSKQNNDESFNNNLLTWYYILSHLFINWFKFQPVLGPWKYGQTSMNVVQRTSIRVCQFSVLIMTVILFFGRTHIKNYETERQRFLLSFDFHPSEIFFMFFICYIATLIIHLIVILCTT